MGASLWTIASESGKGVWMAPTRQPIIFVKKSQSRLMRFYAWLVKPVVPGFAERFWTTVGHTIYVPTQHDNDPSWGNSDWMIKHAETIDHESIHINQTERWGFIGHGLMTIGPAPFLIGIAALLALLRLAFDFSSWWVYGTLLFALALAPLSLGFAWGRWRCEREAYLPSVRAAARRSRVERAERIEFIVNTLWRNYGWAWPRAWMRAWFEKEAP